MPNSVDMTTLTPVPRRDRRSMAVMGAWKSTLLRVTLHLLIGAAAVSAVSGATLPVDAAWAQTLAVPHEQQRLQTLLQATRQETGALAWADAMLAVELMPWLPSATVADLVTSVLAEGAAGPDAATALQFLQAGALRNLGDVEAVAATEDALGLVNRWSIIGPFPNDGGGGLTAILPPEANGMTSGATWPGRAIAVGWQPVESNSGQGYLDLHELVQPSSPSATILVTELTAQTNVDGFLDLAVDGSYRVWLDGQPLAEQPDHLGGGYSRDRIPLRLRRGQRHALMIKIATTEGNYGLHARVLGADFMPANVVASIPEQAPPARQPAAGEPWARPQTLADRLALELGDSTDAAQLASAAWVLHSLQAADPSEPWLAWSERALAQPDIDAESLYRLSFVVREHWRRMELIERARALSEEAHIGLRWVELRAAEMGVSAMQDADRELLRLAAAYPGSVQVRHAAARVLHDGQMFYATLDAMLGLLETFGDSPALLSAVMDAAQTVERSDLAPVLALRMLQQAPGHTGALRTLVAHAIATQDESQVDAWLSRAEALAPHSAEVLQIRAEWRQALGDLDGARVIYERMLALCPGDASLHERVGRLALRQGARERAAESFELALRITPQNAELRDYLTELQDNVDPFHESWRVSVEEILALNESLEERGPDYTWLVDQRVVRVYPNGLATTYVQEAVSIHTRNGADELRSTTIGYSPDSEMVDVLSVRIIGADGSVREAFQDSDYGPPSGPAAMYFDVHTRAISFPSLQEGEVLSFEYTISDISYRNIFDDYFGDISLMQDWAPRALFRYGVIMPSERALYTNVETIPFGESTEEVEGETRTLTFEARNVPRLPREYGTPGFTEIAQYVSVSTYANWDDLANWYWNLVEDQLVVSPEIEAMVASLVEGLTDEREKISRIYEYVVRNTRYVGLEFGIHGYKPYRTSECFARRFGDCKDTASLMKVMLQIAGIDAHLALVRTRDMGRVRNTPASLAIFNHVIVWVPSQNLYLDGTAGFSGSRELPSSDQGATSLLVLDGEGGRIHEIPWLSSESSAYATTLTARVQLNDNGRPVIEGTGSVIASGIYGAGFRQTYESEEQRLQRFGEELAGGYPGIRVTSAEFAGLTDIEVDAGATFVFQGGEFVQLQSGELQVPLFARGNSLQRRFASASTRQMPLALGAPFTLREAASIQLPEGWQATALPDSVTLESAFGRSVMRVRFEQGTLTTEWEFTMLVEQVEPADYASFREFLTQVDQSIDRIARFASEGAP